jgi:hexokinase
MGFKSGIIQDVINDFEVDRENMLRIATRLRNYGKKA